MADRPPPTSSIRQDVSWNLRGASWVCSVPLQLLVHCRDPRDDLGERKTDRLTGEKAREGKIERATVEADGVEGGSSDQTCASLDIVL